MTFAAARLDALDTSATKLAPTWLGDYFGAVVHGQALYVAYPGTAAGATHIYFKKVALQ